MSNAIRNYAGTQKAARTATPQMRRTPGRTDEVKNNAGGFVFEVSPKNRLERFLILGTDGGTYYVKQDKLTEQNAKFVIDLIRKDEALVLNTVVEVSAAGRAAKNTPALFVMALLMTHGTNKAATRAALPGVARTSTHLFEFASYVDALGGWGRAKRAAVAGWYENKDANALAYQAVKYRGGREGWTHRDLFRKSHPVGVDKAVGEFILSAGGYQSGAPAILDGFQAMQNAGTVNEVVRVLNEYKSLPWETIPTQFLTDEKVWKTLFYNGAIGQTALLRNVSRFEKIGAFKDLVFAGDVAAALADSERIVKGRMHPVAYANALGVYGNGGAPKSYDPYGYSGYGRDAGTRFTPNSKVLGALEAGFYNSFAAVEPANKATMLSIDVSGSMTWAAPAGLVGLNYLEAAAVMAMVTLRTEPYAMINAFAGSMQRVAISDSDNFQTVLRKFSNLNFGRTDCSLPMVYATKEKLGIDTFAVYTDNETYAGVIKPSQALVKYRQASGRGARLAVFGMAATPFTIADPKDTGMMDFVGFDSNAPKVFADFSAGRI